MNKRTTGFRFDTRGPNGRRMARSPHAVGGRASDHPELHFPVCTCGGTMTLYLDLDFGSKRLRPSRVWQGRLALFACSSPCEDDGRTFFDLADPARPRVFLRKARAAAAGGHPRDDGLETVPEKLCLRPIVGVEKSACVVGAEPVSEALDPSLRWCPRCRARMTFIAQYAESLSDIPHDAAHTAMLGSPYVQRWYGCLGCKVIAWLGSEALASYD